MNALNFESTGMFSSWFAFLLILLAVCISIGAFTLWLLLRKKGTKRKRKHRQHEHYRRQKNPSRAETGGLPAPRHPDQLPPGP
jgi:hypothetical protein